MTADELEVVVCDFVSAAAPGVTVMRRIAGAPQPGGPYAVVGLVSDEQDGPTDRVQGTTEGNVAYSGHRRFRVQVDVIGTVSAISMTQRIGVMWHSDSAAARAAVVAGVGPAGMTGLRDTSAVRGSSGFVRSASVDLLGYYRFTYADESPPGVLVETIDGTLTDGARTDTFSLTVSDYT